MDDAYNMADAPADDIHVDEDGFHRADGTILSDNDDSDTAVSLAEFVVESTDDEAPQPASPRTLTEEANQLVADFPFDPAMLNENPDANGPRRSRRVRRRTVRLAEELVGEQDMEDIAECYSPVDTDDSSFVEEPGDNASESLDSTDEQEE